MKVQVKMVLLKQTHRVCHLVTNDDVGLCGDVCFLQAVVTQLLTKWHSRVAMYAMFVSLMCRHMAYSHQNTSVQEIISVCHTS